MQDALIEQLYNIIKFYRDTIRVKYPDGEDGDGHWNVSFFAI
jgi:hypothetical protein